MIHAHTRKGQAACCRRDAVPQRPPAAEAAMPAGRQRHWRHRHRARVGPAAPRQAGDAGGARCSRPGGPWPAADERESRSYTGSPPRHPTRRGCLGLSDGGDVGGPQCGGQVLRRAADSGPPPVETERLAGGRPGVKRREGGLTVLASPAGSGRGPVGGGTSRRARRAEGWCWRTTAGASSGPSAVALVGLAPARTGVCDGEGCRICCALRRQCL